MGTTTTTTTTTPTTTILPLYYYLLLAALPLRRSALGASQSSALGALRSGTLLDVHRPEQGFHGPNLLARAKKQARCSFVEVKISKCCFLPVTHQPTRTVAVPARARDWIGTRIRASPWSTEKAARVRTPRSDAPGTGLGKSVRCSVRRGGVPRFVWRSSSIPAPRSFSAPPQSGSLSSSRGFHCRSPRDMSWPRLTAMRSV